MDPYPGDITLDMLTGVMVSCYFFQERAMKKVDELNKDKEDDLMREDEDYSDTGLSYNCHCLKFMSLKFPYKFSLHIYRLWRIHYTHFYSSDVISNTSLGSSASQSQGYDSLVSPRTVLDSPSVNGYSDSSRSDSSDDRSEDFSDSLSSEEEDQLDGESQVNNKSMVEVIWISSDEDDNHNREMMDTPVHSPWEDDLEPPLTPSAPVSVESDVDNTWLG